jgi:hypothetical protein
MKQQRHFRRAVYTREGKKLNSDRPFQQFFNGEMNNSFSPKIKKALLFQEALWIYNGVRCLAHLRAPPISIYAA